MDTGTQGPERISRRDALRRGAILGGTFVWAAPAVQTLGTRGALAQENGTPETADFCPEGEGRITRLILRYTGHGCDNLQPPTAEARQRPCKGETGPLPDTAFVVVNVGNCGGDGPDGPGSETYADFATKFDTEIDAGLGPSGNQACTRFRVYTDSSRNELLADEGIHTSCSAELNIGEQYGPLEIFDGDWEPN